MALHSLLAVVMCKLLLCLQGTRTISGTAHEVQISGTAPISGTSSLSSVAQGHSDDATDEPNEGSYDEALSFKAHLTVVDDEKLLACEVVETKEKMIIQGKDKPFWDYYHAVTLFHRTNMHSPRTINCKNYTTPPKPSSALRNLTNLPEDMVGLIASFEEDILLGCKSCGLVNFNITFFERCSTPSTAEQFRVVQKEVAEEGGNCKVHFEGSAWGRTLQSCLRLNSPALSSIGFRVCYLEPESAVQKDIKELEEQLLGLQKAIDVRKQDMLNLKHIFEGAQAPPHTTLVEQSSKKRGKVPQAPVQRGAKFQKVQHISEGL